MGWFGRRKALKERDELFARVCGKAIKYVARRQVREDGSTEEIVLGKGGRVSHGNGYFMVDAAAGEVFRCDENMVRCAELLSRDGVVVQGVNTHTNEEDTVVAYYVYYR